MLNSQDIDEIVREIQRQAAAHYPQLRIVLTSRYGYVNLERVAKRSDNILLHMVATLEEGLSDAVNRAAIYAKLFDQLVGRSWAKKEGNIEVLKANTAILLREALQDMAHAIFHSGKCYLYKSALDKLPKVHELHRALDNRLDVWRSVMVAFYMDETRKGDRREEEADKEHDYAIEFLHKSLAGECSKKCGTPRFDH